MNTQAKVALRQIAHLRATIEQGALTAAQKRRGEALLERLTSPVRLTLMGLPQSGKSELVNLLLGRRVLPTGQGMPTCRLIWGPAWRCLVTAADGSAKQIRWPVPDGFDWSSNIFVQLEAPIELLKSVAILEAVSDGSPENLAASMAWAMANTDIAVWCTQGMTRLEHAIWTTVPDAIKDHSFLVLTKADQLAASGKLAERITALSGIAEQEFYGLYPVATLQYLAQVGEGMAADPAVRAASGAGGLIDAVMTDIRRGRQADLDGVEVFLGRYGIEDFKAPETAAEPSPVPRPVAAPVAPAANSAGPAKAETPARVPAAKQPPPKPAAPRPAAPAPKAAVPERKAAPPAKGPAPQVQSAPAPAPKPVPQPAAAAAAKAAPSALSADPALGPTLEGLRALGRDLAALDVDAKRLADQVLTLCTERFEDMVSEFSMSGGAVADEIETASELMILMQLEGDERSAADAATVVLQLTRELEFAMAA